MIIKIQIRDNNKHIDMESEVGKNSVTDAEFNNFIIAIKSGSLESVDEYLEKYGAEITNKLESQQRQPPLYFAVNLSDDETCYNCLVKLLRKGANPFFKDNNEQTIIFYAFRDGKQKCVDLLIQHGIKFDDEDAYGQTPLYYVANQNQLSMLKYFDKTEHYNHKDKLAEQTPLYYAAKRGFLDMCKALLQRGCDPTLHDSHNKTAVQYARRAREHDVAELISGQIKKIKEKEKQKQKIKTLTLKSGAHSEHSHQNTHDKKKPKKQEVMPPQQHIPRQVYKIVKISDNGETKDVTEEEIRELFKKNKQLESYFSNPETIPASQIKDFKEKEKELEKSGQEKWQKVAAKVLSFCWKTKGGFWFHEPVDPVKFGIMDYFDIVTKPMDFSTIKKKLSYNFYPNCIAFKQDVQLVFENCFKYNGDEHEISLCAKDVKKVFEKQYSQMLSPYQ